jgi:hypothetical protein
MVNLSDTAGKEASLRDGKLNLKSRLGCPSVLRDSHLLPIGPTPGFFMIIP